jgi:hypothetical protein
MAFGDDSGKQKPLRWITENHLFQQARHQRAY